MDFIKMAARISGLAPEWYSSGREFLNNQTPIDSGKTPAEERAGTSLPGDNPEGVNQYVGTSPQKLLAKLRTEDLTFEQIAEIEHALQIHSACTGDFIGTKAEQALGLKPPKPPAPKPPPFKLT